MAGSGVPAVVCPAVVSALARAVAVIVASAPDVVAQFAVSWRHPPAVARASRVPALAVAELSDDPVPVSREADPVPADASGPTHCSERIARPAAGESESRSGELAEEKRSDSVVGVANWSLDWQDVPSGGRSEGCWRAVFPALPACSHSDSVHSAWEAGRRDGPAQEEDCSLPEADWFALVPECREDSRDVPLDGLPEDYWAAQPGVPLPEEAYSRPEAGWFALVPNWQDVPPVGRRDSWEAVPLCYQHSAPPAWTAQFEAELSEAGPPGSLRALGPRRPSRPVRFSQALPGARLQARSAALEHWKAVCRHCS